MVLDHVPVVIRFQVCIFDILNTAANDIQSQFTAL